jgi:hypothetical protein
MVLNPQYRFEVYKKIRDGEFSPNAILVSGFTDITLRAGIETIKDTVSAQFPNERVNAGSFTRFLGKKNSSENTFSVDDEVRFYAYYDIIPTNKDDALLMHGRISGLGYTTDATKLKYSLKIVNRTEELLNAMTPFSTRAETGSANTCPTAIKQMIRRLNQFHGNDPKRYIVAYLSSEINPITGSPGRIQNIRSDGTAFPRIDYNETWKPIYYNIEKLSGPDYTGDENVGAYLTYITYSKVKPEYQSLYGTTINELVWEQKTFNVNGNLIEGVDFVRPKIDRDIKDVQNILIVNAGTDRQGAGITGVAYNLESIAKYGAKVGYYTKSRRVFSNIWSQEVSYAQGLSKQFDADGMPSNISGSNAYPLVMSFKDRDNYTGSFNGSTLTANTKKEWNQYLRDEARWQVVIEAQKLLEKLGIPKYNIKVDSVIGSNNIVLGGIYGFVVPSYGWDGNVANPAYKLRIQSLAHTLNKEGWATQIEALEDELAISRMLGNSPTSY